MNTMPFTLHRTTELMPSPFLLRRRPLRCLGGVGGGGGEGPGCFHCINCLLVCGSKWWTQHSSRVRKRSRKLAWSASKIARFACDGASHISFCSGIKNHSTHLAETFDIPNTLCRLFSTPSREMPMILANLIYSETCVIHHASKHSITTLCTSYVFLSCCYFGSSTPGVILEAPLAHLKMHCPSFDYCI